MTRATTSAIRFLRKRLCVVFDIIAKHSLFAPTPTPKCAHASVRLLEEAALALLVAADLERLAPLDGVHANRLAGVALQAQHDLLRRLRLLVEHGLGLTAETTLLAVVATLACSFGGTRAETTRREEAVSERREERGRRLRKKKKKPPVTEKGDCERTASPPHALRTPASTLNAMGDAQRGRATRRRAFATRRRAIARVGIVRIHTARLASFHRSRRVSSVRFRAGALAKTSR